ncbi:OmpA family protein [Streptomyces spiramenti]|uniref:OmpA family protein n=1 Tax=Streptomyces spiramenti TaxID=2720606 RepID=A0ABX1APG6_9ACTN|nr:OmpA family protein [Streptomyces spiramenti]NJP68978.1 OmpA family protein [Streptomyces spiramenti]
MGLRSRLAAPDEPTGTDQGDSRLVAVYRAKLLQETDLAEMSAMPTREERTGGQRKFVLQAGVLFEESEADLSEESLASLEAVAAAIEEEQPEWVNIFGFTDSQGSYDFGVQLSNERAENTQLALIDLMGDAGDITFNINGYSEEYFLYDNSTDEGRQKNRRVEISWPTGG